MLKSYYDNEDLSKYLEDLVISRTYHYIQNICLEVWNRYYHQDLASLLII